MIKRRAVLGLAALFPVWPVVGRAQGLIDPGAAHAAALSGELLLVDIRRPDEWAETGVAGGAVALDMRRGDFIASLLRKTGGRKDAPIALICAGGVRSSALAETLSRAGFSDVSDVGEGMFGSPSGPGWLARGLPVTAP